MSVIVNMEMPQNCKDCMDSGLSVAVSVFGAMCPFCEKVFVVDFNINIEKQRLKNCPLIELPPHGRMIAEKTITEIRYHDADGYHIVNGEQLCELEIDAPTVIEAEGSE